MNASAKLWEEMFQPLKTTCPKLLSMDYLDYLPKTSLIKGYELVISPRMSETITRIQENLELLKHSTETLEKSKQVTNLAKVNNSENKKQLTGDNIQQDSESKIDENDISSENKI